MYQGRTITPPFFELGPKGYIYGEKALEMALAAEEASQKYGVEIIYTPQYTDLPNIAAHTTRLIVCAQHMDPVRPGRGLGSVLPEAVKSCGAHAVMLNHAEKPVALATLRETIQRADAVGLLSVACADSILDARAIALFAPNVIIAEPSELIGTGKTSDLSYVQKSIAAIKSVNPDILILQASGIRTAEDVYNVIHAGADATGCTSGIMCAEDPIATMRGMVQAVREAWDATHKT